MLHLLRQLWRDEAGYVMSAEAVTVGTIGVVGATVGIGAVSKSVNDELTDTAYAIRSLNQSYVIPEQFGSGAWTAGSFFVQPDPEQARAELGRYIEEQGGTRIDYLPYENGRSAAFPNNDRERSQPQPVEHSSPESREELRRIRQRKRGQSQIRENQSTAPALVDAE